MGAIISRFAPAPTGFLHLGHVVNAVYVWSETRVRRGRVLLRIEDHDRQRSRREYDAEILDDLAWLGFEADGPPARQSERGEIYESALNALRRQGLVYACACSRSDVARAAGRLVQDRQEHGAAREPGDPEGVALHDGDTELWYPGTCRDRSLAEGAGVGLRVRLAPTVERFVDLRHGPQEQRPSEQCGDLLAKDREGNWTYQFAAAVDDYVQGVTLVVRGDDLLPSTGRQIQLARLLGRTEPPQFLHHPLILKSSGGHAVKLSKSDGDSGIRELRAKGWTAKNVIDHAMSLVGRFPYDHAS